LMCTQVVGGMLMFSGAEYPVELPGSRSATQLAAAAVK
jgi:hypothetical protein